MFHPCTEIRSVNVMATTLLAVPNAVPHVLHLSTMALNLAWKPNLTSVKFTEKLLRMKDKSCMKHLKSPTLVSWVEKVYFIDKLMHLSCICVYVMYTGSRSRPQTLWAHPELLIMKAKTFYFSIILLALALCCVLCDSNFSPCLCWKKKSRWKENKRNIIYRHCS